MLIPRVGRVRSPLLWGDRGSFLTTSSTYRGPFHQRSCRPLHNESVSTPAQRAIQRPPMAYSSALYSCCYCGHAANQNNTSASRRYRTPTGNDSRDLGDVVVLSPGSPTVVNIRFNNGTYHQQHSAPVPGVLDWSSWVETGDLSSQTARQDGRDQKRGNCRGDSSNSASRARNEILR